MVETISHFYDKAIRAVFIPQLYKLKECTMMTTDVQKSNFSMTAFNRTLKRFMIWGLVPATLAGCATTKTEKYSSDDNLITEQTVQIKTRNPSKPLEVSRRGKGAQGVDANRPFMGVAIGATRAIADAGENILLKGGNAVDAVISMTFMQAVTRPHLAGLGSQGACMIHNSKIGLTEVLDFAPKDSLMPTMARSMGVLHSRYGELAWGQLIVQPEQQARRGIKVTPEMVTASGGKIIEGQRLSVDDNLYRDRLSLTLSLLRLQGGGALHSGRGLDLLIEDAKGLGVYLNKNAVMQYQPAWRGSVPVYAGDYRVYLLGEPSTLGTVTGQTLSVLQPAMGKNWRGANRTKMVAESLGKIQNTPFKSGVSIKDTTVMAVDDAGLAVICQTSLNGDFGFGGTSTKLGMTFPNPAKQFSYLPIIGTDAEGKFMFMMSVHGKSATLYETITAIGDAMYGPAKFSNITLPARTWTDGIKWYAEQDYKITDANSAQSYLRQSSGTQLNGVLCPSTLPAPGANIACSATADSRGQSYVGFAGYDSVSQSER